MHAAPKRGHQPPPAAAPDEVLQAIRRRAEELYELSGRVPGRDLQNWAQAEAEIRPKFGERMARMASIVVKVDGVRYVGEYNVEAADGYTPGEFASGDPVPVRLEGDKMYVKRPTGKELETTIVSKTD